MKLHSLILRNSLFLLTLILALPAFRAAAQSKLDNVSAAQTPAVAARITQAIDETRLVRLHGNVHPLARPEFDQGIVSDATPMNRILLLLQRSPEQQAALSKFMDEQLSKDSPNFHKWLTPQDFGKLYGPADADIQTVTDWLTRQGFQGIKVGAGRTAIEFSGNVAQVRNAFHTEIHQFNVDSKSRQANISDPQIPAALTPVVAGILSLHNFPRHSFRHDVGIHTATREVPGKPQFTTTSGCGTNHAQPCYVVGPADFAKIYNIPLALDGTGQQIAIVADSNINPQDVTDFRTLFGLPNNPPNVIPNGPDPGKNGDEGEADLDVQIAGMVATGGLAVSGIASTPFNTAVGGTDFDDFSPSAMETSFWATANGTGKESALGYIHEIPWNDSCAATATSTTLNTVCTTANGIVGGGGGPSGINAGTFAGYPKPAWQSGIIPNGIAAGDNHRYIPDVSLFASDGPQSQSFYLVCQADAIKAGSSPSCASSGSFSFLGVGGTSASAPAFAGIMALIN